MKQLLRAFSLFVCAITATTQWSWAQQQQCAIASVNQAIRGIVESWKDGYNSGEPEKVAALYAPNATYLTQHFVTGVIHGRPAIQAYVKRGTDAHYRIDHIELLASECSGEFAYAITRYDSTNGDQKAFGVNLVVLQKIKGKWLIVAHEAAVPDPATAIRSLESPTPIAK